MRDEGELLLRHPICGHQAVPAKPAMACHQRELSDERHLALAMASQMPSPDATLRRTRECTVQRTQALLTCRPPGCGNETCQAAKQSMNQWSAFAS